MSEKETLTRRAAREARRAALSARSHEDGNQDGPPSPMQAAREAATAAAVGAAVGAVRALAASQRGEEDEAQPEPEQEQEQETQPEAEAEDLHEDEDEDRDERAQPAPPRAPREGIDPSQVERAVHAAREQLKQLHGADAESVSSFGRTRDGWRVTLEVLELRRIPPTTDVLASYLVELDGDGNLVAYERLRRYHRSEAGEGGR